MKVQDRASQNLVSWEKLSSEVQTSDLVKWSFLAQLKRKRKRRKNKENSQLGTCAQHGISVQLIGNANMKWSILATFVSSSMNAPAVGQP